ncbi:MgtC/SapB family protein [Gillisia marina]|uniref:MgtC/SapB family protein n=1 Tax=Gillisia marina TaxID=1167637 RepID=UPI00029A5E31|nr:MgtC/SapB family protein [Gillisia marina]
MELLEFSIRVGLAALAGLLIGAEREIRGKSAGLKTNALVALGASVFVLASLTFKGEEFVDITRVLGQVVSGIGFIGAGTILQQKGSIKGLTTAATIWCSAGAGCLAALEMYKELAVICVIIISINYTFGVLERKLLQKKNKN